MSQRPIFSDTVPVDVYERPKQTPVCDRCGAEGEPQYMEVSTYGDVWKGIRRWLAVEWKCPNGPHPRGEL